MEPLPETRVALEELGRVAGGDLLPSLLVTAGRVRLLVPSCVGLSLTLRRDDLTFTFVSTSEELSRLDAAQYLDGGPCVEGAETGEVVALHQGDVLAEEQWSTFARATAAAGIATTLTLPLIDGAGRPIGTINLYAGEKRAFDGLHEDLADIVGAWAPGAVADADLSFHTKQVARSAPALLEERVLVGRAVHALMTSRGIDQDAAKALIRDVAARAGTTQAVVAHLVLDLDLDLDPDTDLDLDGDTSG